MRHDYCPVCREHEEELITLRAAVEVLAREVVKWRDCTEDNHDQDYGHCRKSCTKCEGERNAWTHSHTTDANPTAKAAIDAARDKA